MPSYRDTVSLCLCFWGCYLNLKTAIHGKTTGSSCSRGYISPKGIPIKTLCYCCPLNGCLWGKQVPFSSGLHTDTKGTNFLWLLLFAYTLPLSSCLLALASCQVDREFVPTQWQVSDGEALCLKKTLSPLSLSLPSLLIILPSVVSFCPSFPSLHFSSIGKLFKNTPVHQHFHIILG